MSKQFIVIGNMTIDRARIVYIKKCGENACVVCVDIRDGSQMHTVQVPYDLLCKYLNE